jgi:hypothetical protein
MIGTARDTITPWRTRPSSVPCARPIKPVYIRQFVALIDKLEGAK